VATTDTVDTARRVLGPVGVTLPVSFTTALSIDLQRESVARLEEAGYGAAWTNEVIGGKDALVQLAVLLAATRRLAFGTAIANIWARQPQIMHGAAAVLAQAYPDRFVLGLGVGYPQQAADAGLEFGKPLATMREYCERMHAPAWPPAPDAAYPRIIAANGPKMLAQAGEIADGALPAMVPPEHTVQARKVLGPNKLLVVGLSVVPDGDHERAAATARKSVSNIVSQPAYAAAVARLGYSAEDIAQVSDRLVNSIVGHGGPEAIAAKVREHLAAGADHVTLLLPIGTDFAAGIDQLVSLAPALDLSAAARQA
jgi:probable F420-dependent oxidoreductase